MKRRSKKRKRGHKKGLAKRYGRSYGPHSEVGIPVRVHGTLFIAPHADERLIDTIAEVVEEVVPEVVEEAVAELESGEHDYWPAGRGD